MKPRLLTNNPPAAKNREHQAFSRIQRRSAGCLIGCLLSCLNTAALAGTIRHDVDDILYTDLAADPRYEATGSHTASGGTVCSATLIGPEWVLTAAHCVEGLSNHRFSLGENRSIGTMYSAAEAIAHGAWNPANVTDGNDIALIQLDTPAFDATPAQVYRGSDELGEVSTHVGYGWTGTGITGHQSGTGGTKRAGQNTIDIYGDQININGEPTSSALFYADFDNPDNRSDSTLGQRRALALEYMISFGDSGGGAYIEVEGVNFLTGVHSFISASDGVVNADYGDLMAVTRVGQYTNWIDTNTGNAITQFSNGGSFDWHQSGWSVGDEVDGNDTAVINGGTIRVTSGDQVAKYVFVDGDSLLQVDGGSLAVDTLILKRGGRLEAPGITGNILNQSGIFAPQLLSGGAVIEGGYNQEESGELVFDLSSINDQSPLLAVNGPAELAGTLNLLNGSTEDFAFYDEITLIQTAPDSSLIAGHFGLINGLLAGDDSLFAVTYQTDSVSVQRALPGDVNLDGQVDQDDLNTLASFFDSEGTWINGDFNGDALVNLDDLTILGGFFGSGVAAAGQISFAAALQLTTFSVPEPVSLIPILVTGLMITRRRRG